MYFWLFFITVLHGTSGPADGDGPSTVGPLGPMGTLGAIAGRGGQSSVRRGPGRPRLRPAGPGNQGYRVAGSHHQGKRIQRPLPVPLRSHQLSGSHGKSSSKSPNLPPPSTIGVASSSAAGGSSSLSFRSSVDARPFGFYTQQQQQLQQQARDDRPRNPKPH